MKIIYRISDGSYKKERFDFITKKSCLANFIQTGKLISDPGFEIIADNCNQETMEMIRSYPLRAPMMTHFGNGSESWKFGALHAIQNYSEDDIVYFVEDDYLHRPGWKEIITEGMEIADYVSLYDHPDKYLDGTLGGNPYVEHSGEITRVFRTKSTHWKLTNSTTMTFAVKVRTLKEDWDVWDRATQTAHPNDFAAFIELMHKPRYLISPIPAYSTHCETAWAAPGVDWRAVAYGEYPQLV